jgi:hypothetical protein
MFYTTLKVKASEPRDKYKSNLYFQRKEKREKSKNGVERNQALKNFVIIF